MSTLPQMAAIVVPTVVLGPLVGELAANRQTLTDLAGRIGELERENGRLTERLALMAPESCVASNLTPEPPDPTPESPQPLPWPLPPHPNVRIVGALALVVAVLLVAGVLLLR
jgi:hypothetical protein